MPEFTLNISQIAAQSLVRAFDRSLLSAMGMTDWDDDHPKPSYRTARRDYWRWKKERSAELDRRSA